MSQQLEIDVLDMGHNIQNFGHVRVGSKFYLSILNSFILNFTFKFHRSLEIFQEFF